MRAEELTAKFGLAGVLDFIETEHGLVKLDDLSLTQPINCALVMSGDAGEGFILVWSHERRPLWHRSSPGWGGPQGLPFPLHAVFRYRTVNE